VTIKGASELHEALHAAIEGNDADAFNNLVRQHLAEIMARFDSWTTIPAEIRTDQDAVSRYVESLYSIARAFEAAGEPTLIDLLVGPDETNPIVQWNRRLSQAQALSEAGEYPDSDVLLNEILAEMEGASGPTVVNLRPKILGKLGFNALHEREYSVALDYTEQAYDACATAGDEEGLVTYYENLMALRVVQALDTEPENGQRLLDVRRLVARAQDATDAGRYQASTDKLSEALSALQDHGESELFRALLPKVHGLLGFNAFKLGRTAKAREHCALALEAAQTNGDSEGVRIYAANIESIDDACG
jgi:tetratricopeptide (TPR) repeat protein